MYPVKNFAYIDILFLSTGATTQGGLNTVDLNGLTLYQQLIIFLTTIVATPIWIHGGLAFVRYYWFERYFDGINAWSKRDFQTRRTMTMRQREQSKGRLSQTSGKNDRSRMEAARGKNVPNGGKDISNFQGQLFSGQAFGRDEGTETSPKEEEGKVLHNDTPEMFIGRRKSRDINPADMYRSIAILQNKQDQSVRRDGPALVIKSPAERERELEEEQKRKKREEEGQLIKFQVDPVPNKHKQTVDSPPVRGSFSIGRRPSFFQKLQSTGKLKLKLKKPNRSSHVLYDDYEDEEEGHDADMEEDSSVDEDALAISSDEHENLTSRGEQEGNTDILDEVRSSYDSHSSSPESISSENVLTDSEGQEEPYYSRYSEEEPHNLHLDRPMSANYLSYQPRIGRNSTFVGLSDSQKTELGGVEYRATKLLCLLLAIYYFGFNILAMIVFSAWVGSMKKYTTLIRDDGISPQWWAYWMGMSSVANLGLTLTPDSMSSFNKSIYVLIWMIAFIIIGNTGFPILLRFIIWILYKLSPELSLRRESLQFLLDHPRRCFTMLFPKAATWWLFFVLVALNVIDLVLFIVLDLNASVVEALSPGIKVLDGLFQAVSTRTAGFSVVDLSQLHPAVQVSYMLMMYVSVMPLAISIRRTNVYEEQSLGIYGRQTNDTEGEGEGTEKNTKTFISAHLRRQLSFDLWYMFLGLFIICICEGSKIQDPEQPDFTVFRVLFEVVSAYGTVGLSLGYPDTDQSFSAQFNTLSKLVIIAMLIRGRHRGLPYTLDRAIILPSEKLKENDMLNEYTFSRMATSDFNRTSSRDVYSASRTRTYDSTNTGLTFDGLRRRNKAFWKGFQGVFSMGHAPMTHHLRAAKSFDDYANVSLSTPYKTNLSARNEDIYQMHYISPESLNNEVTDLRTSSFATYPELGTSHLKLENKSNDNENSENTNTSSGSKRTTSLSIDPLASESQTIQSIESPRTAYPHDHR